MTVDGTEVELTRAQARRVQSALGEALTGSREFFRTVGEHREDGTYEVSRRCADSAGNAKVFDDFAQVERIYRTMPREFTATEVEEAGVTGSRRHMLVHHFAEHPAFDCEVVCRNPLTVRKPESTDDPAEMVTDREAPAD